MEIKTLKRLKLIFLSLLVIGSATAQDLSKLSPEQLEMYKKYMAGKNAATTTNSSTNSSDLELKDTREKATVNVTNTNPKRNKNSINNVDSLDQNSKDEYFNKRRKLTIFGSYLFNSQNLTFEPKLTMPTPTNYILGASDELIIDISGLYDANYKLKVSPEGSIRIPNVGPVKVSGLKMEVASNTIKNMVSRIYQGVSSGQTKVNVSLGNIRSIRVTIVGEAVRPGSYNLPSLATVFNALYACGGPNDIGTMREVKVIRAGSVIAKLDLYKFLVEGLMIDNIVLQDEDVIKIDPYKIRTYINGAVKRVGIFEGIEGETLQTLVGYAGGFADNAYTDKITTFRLTGKEKTVVDVTKPNISTFSLNTGDSVVVSTTLDRYDNRIDLVGSVFRPGTYALEPGLTVKKLIAKADGVKEDAYLNMAYITRKKDNTIPEIIGFNLGEVLSGKSPDILLFKNDSVSIRSLFDYRDKQSVYISGAVKAPGEFPLIQNISLKDLIFKAKGFTEMASTDSVELIRPIKDQKDLFASDKKSIVMKFALDKELNFKDGAGDILLQTGDQVVVRYISGYEGVRMVRIEGEVLSPGSYNITSKSERISDVIKRAGGFTNYAYPVGAFLIRSEKATEVESKLFRIMQENIKNQLETKENKTLDANMLRASGATSVQGYTAMDSIQRKLSGSNVAEKIFNPEGVVGINLKEIVEFPGSKYDLKLEEGDIIYVPRELQTVRVLGQVLFPTMVRFERNRSLSYYIDNSGGYSLNANRSKVFVLYPNGAAQSTKSFLWIRTYPKVTAGSRIVIPEKPIEIRNKLTPAETVAILTSITTAISLMYSILKKQ